MVTLGFPARPRGLRLLLLRLLRRIQHGRERERERERERRGERRWWHQRLSSCGAHTLAHWRWLRRWPGAKPDSSLATLPPWALAAIEWVEDAPRPLFPCRRAPPYQPNRTISPLHSPPRKANSIEEDECVERRVCECKEAAADAEERLCLLSFLLCPLSVPTPPNSYSMLCSLYLHVRTHTHTVVARRRPEHRPEERTRLRARVPPYRRVAGGFVVLPPPPKHYSSARGPYYTYVLA